MKRILLIALLASPLCTHAQAPAGAPAIAPGSAVDPAVSLNAMLDGTEKQMMGLVKAMPADKYDFAPSAAIHCGASYGVRRPPRSGLNVVSNSELCDDNSK